MIVGPMWRPATELYAKAPAWAQHVACSAEGLRIRLARFPPGFDARVQRADRRLRWTETQRTADRHARLRAMLIHAGQHVPYWRDLFASLGFCPQRLQHEDELEALPLLTKDIVVEQGSRMWAEQVPAAAGGYTQLNTSGTTGAGLVFRASQSATREQWAVCWRHRQSHGISRQTWSAQLGGRVIVPLGRTSGPLWRVNIPGRQVLFSGYHLGPATAERYLDTIDRLRLPWIHGYPSLVVPLARAALATRRRLPSLRWITLASENVGPAQRDLIREAFSITPRELYAQTEAVANACEWPDGALRLDDDFSVVELRPHPSANDPTLRRIVGTSLDNWHQPFIRYDTGDLARVDPGANDRPRAPGRALQSVDGRDEDYVELPSGARVGRLDHIFKSLTFVHEAQIRQRERGPITIAVVPRSTWRPEHDARLREQVTARLGDDLPVHVQVERALPRTSRGKLRLVVRDRS